MNPNHREFNQVLICGNLKKLKKVLLQIFVDIVVLASFVEIWDCVSIARKKIMKLFTFLHLFIFIYQFLFSPNSLLFFSILLQFLPIVKLKKDFLSNIAWKINFIS